ncbi:branched-chain amino acid ABC transporter permease [Mangrovicoccus ximenensis]|uniref:branched-chain amino acid ABC transporter permease n=1 Tax=Mangrovicoccus ximenensis TaxID=1911570 RepID=UPI000D3D24B2|nr:branched-chain amino acid ABC transporter permease [Mangrovicoccus ximenensis]
MSDAAPAHAPRIERAGLSGRLRPLIPWLLVPAAILLGYLGIWAQASWPLLEPVLNEDGTLRTRVFDLAPFDVRLSSWLTLTVSGLAMGMMIFVMASGLTLVFGLMDVINFGHGAFVAIGAFTGITVLLAFPGLAGAESLAANLALVGLAALAAMAVTGLLGGLFERIIIRPVYGAHLKQILVTMGGLIVAEQMIHVVWGPSEIFIARPEMLKGALTFHGAAIETYRLMAVGLGLAIFLAIRAVLRHTTIGLIVRAGVQNGEMVEALGYRLRLVFVGVFIAGSALAGLGGVMWGLYQEVVTATMGAEIMVLVFIVVIIGGLGSVEGCFLGALLVGLTQNYVAFLEPKAALVSDIALMVLILMWRPEGMMSAGGRR